jgi:hypothetical protein
MSETPAREDGFRAGLRTIAWFNAGTERLRADLGASAAELPLIEAGLLALAVAGPLQWHYGPIESDPDWGKMWCYGCGAEVYALEGGYICSGCERQAG